MASKRQEIRDYIVQELSKDREKLDNDYNTARMIKQNENNLRNEFDLDEKLNSNKK